jgi:hypothetical protein
LTWHGMAWRFKVFVQTLLWKKNMYIFRSLINV